MTPTLLTDGKNTFPFILDKITNAKTSLLINMFIWRDDKIGNELAKACLDFANRGGKIKICVDRYAFVLERSEESKKSLFHQKTTFFEFLSIKYLDLCYPMENTPKRQKTSYPEIYYKLKNHPNIAIENNIKTCDHSKFYIIDEKTLIMGGINIEDKENGADMQGRVYQDYMVCFEDEKIVNEFKNKVYKGEKSTLFTVNTKQNSLHFFEMENTYKRIIDEANVSLEITMAYLSPIKWFLKSIQNAYKRGVKITVLISKSANYQDDLNKKTVQKLMKLCNNDITLLESPKMLHTKLVMNEKEISLGSTNITKKAFKQLSEANVNICKTNTEYADFVNDLTTNVKANYALSEQITDFHKIKYNKLNAFLEGFVM